MTHGRKYIFRHGQALPSLNIYAISIKYLFKKWLLLTCHGHGLNGITVCMKSSFPSDDVASGESRKIQVI